LSVGALLHLDAFRFQEAFQVSEHFFFVDLFHMGPNFCIHDSRRMPRRQLQEKRRQSQPIAIFGFSIATTNSRILRQTHLWLN
jgi:hypothetical protein